MTGKRNEERRKLASLADELFDDLLATSDEDILNEVIEVGGDPEAIGDQMRDEYESILLRARKDRMKAARAGRKAMETAKGITKAVDISTARRLLREAFQHDGLSMAARNETEGQLTDEEVLRKYNDLIRLGVIHPEDEDES